ncbi:ankyrin repeat protein [Actimicrobium sp. GrIS 1.19]|uniref:ShET2/EspL2 family type III secretion system effector toxin n=1 Tax=Actimicrobium sp. GrIS 1.19 TaxID=3071708 RepID=UPI002DFF7CEF|nr:ankyrin repeat protein [Actimicrobium sp. GrIS 1.19]
MRSSANTFKGTPVRPVTGPTDQQRLAELIATLYPAGVDGPQHGQMTPLDRKLRDLPRYGAAKRKELLSSLFHPAAVAHRSLVPMDTQLKQAVVHAIQNDRRDSLRGFALLLSDDHIERVLARPFNDSLLQAALLKPGLVDDGLKAVIKRYPYRAPKTEDGDRVDAARNMLCLNGRARLIGSDGVATGKNAVCANLAAVVIDEWNTDPQQKFNYNNFKDIPSIEARVKPESTDRFDALKASATEVHLIRNEHFGRFLGAKFRQMLDSDATSMVLLANSSDHAMSVGLRIKKDPDGTPVFVVKFFDPNRTLHHARASSSSLATFEHFSVGSFIDDARLVAQYFQEAEPATMLFVCEPGGADAPAASHRDRSLMSQECTPDSGLLFRLMIENFGAEIRAISEQMRRMSVDEKIALLTARRFDDDRGLHLAMLAGHADAIRAFCVLLGQVPEALRAALIDTTDLKGSGETYLMAALEKSNFEAVRAYAELMRLVPEAERRPLLSPSGRTTAQPMLYSLMRQNLPDAMRAMQSLIEALPEADRLTVLAARSSANVPGLFFAAHENNFAAIRAFAPLLSQVPPSARAELVAANNHNGSPALHFALRLGHAEVIEAFGELIDTVPEEQREALLAAVSPDGSPGLFRAALGGNHAAVRAFSGLLIKVPEQHRAALVAACASNGIPALHAALAEGHAETVRAWRALLELVPQEQRFDLLAAKDGIGRSGLFIAAAQGKADAIAAFTELRDLVPIEQRLGLLAPAPDGSTLLAAAEHSGDAATIAIVRALESE